jgi:Icc protein
LSEGAQQPLRVVQVTDCHLFADTEGKLLGLNTQFSLDRVLEKVEQCHPDMDIILATGDLAQDASLDAYQRLFKRLHKFDVPIYWMKGNHDKIDPMLATFASERERVSPCVTEQGNWTIILLDSTIPGNVPGELFQDDLDFLKRTLAEAKGKHILVSLHHHPVPMGCTWLDTQIVSNADDFFALIDVEPRVRAILWGHVHQAFEGERKGVKLISTPSTCVQFKPKSHDFAVDTLPPGYRWLNLFADGRIETGVERVEGIEFEVDFSVKGY